MKTYLLICGDFTPWGGMDRANYELAWHLADRLGAAVHLVGHSVAAPLVEHPNITWHRVAKPLSSYSLSAPLLAWQGRRVARVLARQGARIIVNGGNCAWPDINWVHAVHAAWNNRDRHASVSFRLRNAWRKQRARHAERRAVPGARIVVVNSQRARQGVMDALGIVPERAQVVYLGCDPAVFRPFTPPEQAAARRRLGLPDARLIVAFIGALGQDRNKGFDVLFTAWQQLCRNPACDVDLVAAGQGAEVRYWQQQVEEAELAGRVHVLGFVRRIDDVFAAADALVSPTHYDAYGLSVHEAVCCGLPAFVTRSAGVAERYPSDLSHLLLDEPPGADDVAARLLNWRRDPEGYRLRVKRFGEAMRQRTWADMAEEMVDIIERAA